MGINEIIRRTRRRLKARESELYREAVNLVAESEKAAVYAEVNISEEVNVDVRKRLRLGMTNRMLAQNLKELDL